MRRTIQVVVVAAAVLALQVILPRVFSVVLWYHLGYFIVSLALLGHHGLEQAADLGDLGGIDGG